MVQILVWKKWFRAHASASQAKSNRRRQPAEILEPPCVPWPRAHVSASVAQNKPLLRRRTKSNPLLFSSAASLLSSSSGAAALLLWPCAPPPHDLPPTLLLRATRLLLPAPLLHFVPPRAVAARVWNSNLTRRWWSGTWRDDGDPTAGVTTVRRLLPWWQQAGSCRDDGEAAPAVTTTHPGDGDPATSGNDATKPPRDRGKGSFLQF